MKRVAFVAAAAVIIAVIFGIAAYSFMQPSNAPDEPDLDSQSESIPPENISAGDQDGIAENASDGDRDINSLDNIPGYFGLLSLGYSDQMARYLSSSNLEMISSNNTYYHYIHTTPNGTRSESILSITPNEAFDTTGSKKITVAPGFDIFAKQVQVKEIDNGYHITLSYFIPEEGMPWDLEEYSGTVQPINAELPFGIKYAHASGTLIYGTGVALERTVISPPKITATPPEPIIETVIKGQQNRDAVREVQQMIMDRDWALEDARSASERANVRADRITKEMVDKATQDALRKQRLDLSKIIDRAAREEAAEALSKTAGRVVGGLGTAWSLSNIYDDFMKGLDLVGAARDCWENPTNRLAQDAQRNDPFYDRLGEQLDSAKTGHAVTTGARVGNAAVDAAVGAKTGFVGVLGSGSLAQANDAMLHSVQFDEIYDAIKGITPCTPCPEETQNPDVESPPQPSGDYTPGPDEPGFYYTIGPRSSYEPPKPEVCKPPVPNQVRILINDRVKEYEYPTTEARFDATANVTNLADITSLGPAGTDRLVIKYGEYFGNATSIYSYKAVWPATYNSDPCTVQINGLAEMRVKILPNMPPEGLAEVQVAILGPLPVTMSPPGCDNSYDSDTGDRSIYSCNFFDVDLARGGHYLMADGPRSTEGSTFYDECQLFLSPLDESRMAPAVPPDLPK